jgi:hypothetical protein
MRNPNPPRPLAVLPIAFAVLLAGCGESVQVQTASDPNAPPAPSSAGIPDDATVLKEMQDRISGETSIALSDDGAGEIVWSGRDLTWYYQRGYIVHRPANIDGFDDATLEVGGLSLWVFDGQGWRHQRDLVTWNAYDGIPDPDTDGLVELLEGARVNYMPAGLGGRPANIRLAEAPKFEWHDAKSVSFDYVVDAPHIDWPSQTLRQATLTLRTRVYRDGIDAAWRDPLQPELVDVVVHTSEKKTPAELSAAAANAAP